jgi:hypothetical protein
MKKTKNNKKKERKKNADLALVLIGNKNTIKYNVIKINC